MSYDDAFATVRKVRDIRINDGTLFRDSLIL